MQLFYSYLSLFDLLYQLVKDEKLIFSLFLLFKFGNVLKFFFLFCLFEILDEIFYKLSILDLLLIKFRQIHLLL